MSLAEQFFNDEYSPELVDRDSEKTVLKEYLQDVLRGKKRAFYIHGPPGVGKTTTTKHVVNQFEDAHGAEIVYRNSANATPNLVLHEIHNRICPEVEGRIPSKTLVQRISNHKLKDEKFTLVLVLDNFDRMQHVDDLLWDVQTISQRLPRFGLILISTSQAKLRQLMGQRLYDRLNPYSHEFLSYDSKRLFEIIDSRIKQAYSKDFADDDALMSLCEFVAERGGNARYLFSLFLDAVEAIPGNSPKLSSEIQDVIERERGRELKNTLEEIRVTLPTKFEVLKIIHSSNKLLDTGSVISLATEKGLHISPRTVQNYLTDLERMKLIKLEKIRKGQGHSQLIKPLVLLKDLD